MLKITMVNLKAYKDYVLSNKKRNHINNYHKEKKGKSQFIR